jgi:hypothetical protein
MALDLLGTPLTGRPQLLALAELVRRAHLSPQWTEHGAPRVTTRDLLVQAARSTFTAGEAPMPPVAAEALATVRNNQTITRVSDVDEMSTWLNSVLPGRDGDVTAAMLNGVPDRSGVAIGRRNPPEHTAVRRAAQSVRSCRRRYARAHSGFPICTQGSRDVRIRCATDTGFGRLDRACYRP